MNRSAADPEVHQRRWRILAVLCASVFLVVVDNTIVNVALPTLSRQLGATTSQLQWVVDAYSLVFAGLLLAAGSLGDRFGRKGALQGGMVLFGLFSGLAALASTPAQLIAARAAMGVGAALVFPATLAILANVFTDARERAKAIGVWTGVSGLAIALGPVTGGWLLEHFWWGSVFLVNVPLAGLAVLIGRRMIPESADPNAPARQDIPGLLLSIAGISTLVWTIIEAPGAGWGSTQTLIGFAAAAVIIAAFVARELTAGMPMLDVRIFRNARFTAASISVTLAFFALFGFVFVVTQYLQFVQGYSTLEAGVRTVPFAAATGIAAPLAALFTRRWGTKRVVATGLAAMAVGLLVAASSDAGTGYGTILISMLIMGGGLGLTTAPATESIMGSLPREKAGVGSAVNDTTRELGGTLGVALIGSLFASAYHGSLANGLAGVPLPSAARHAADQSIRAAMAVAAQAPAGPRETIADAARTAFLAGFTRAAVVAAVVVAAAAVVALLFLPARADEVAEVEQGEVEPGEVEPGELAVATAVEDAVLVVVGSAVNPC
jgi:EmrB/QacA subfamily drug resistance transporter